MYKLCSVCGLLMFVGTVSTIDVIYYGDVDFWTYLDQLCVKLKSIPYPKTVLVLIEAFQNSFENKQNQSRNFLFDKLIDFNCPFELLQDAYLVHNGKFRLNDVVIFVDLTFVSVVNEIHFKQYLSSLNQFYLQCLHCSMVTSVFNVSTSRLYDLSKQMMPNVNKDFRSVLVSTTTNRTKGSVVHIRPIIHGCLLYQGVLVPKTQNQFDQLKTPYEMCNLNSSTMNVAINHVNIYSYLIVCLFIQNRTLIGSTKMCDKSERWQINRNQTFYWIWIVEALGKEV